MWNQFFDGPVDFQSVLIAVVPTLVAAWICGRIARRLVAAALRALVRDTLSPSSPLVRAPLRIFAAAAFILAFAVLLFPAFEMAGLQTADRRPAERTVAPGRSRPG